VNEVSVFEVPGQSKIDRGMTGEKQWELGEECGQKRDREEIGRDSVINGESGRWLGIRSRHTLSKKTEGEIRGDGDEINNIGEIVIGNSFFERNLL
jgi:hypothetical protein